VQVQGKKSRALRAFAKPFSGLEPETPPRDAIQTATGGGSVDAENNQPASRLKTKAMTMPGES
jgi:hypothetical protein